MRVKIESVFEGQQPSVVFGKGELIAEKGGFVLNYKEPSEDGLQYVSVELSPNKAIITRPAAKMVIEKEKAHLCPYKTVAGVFEFEFFGKEINYDFNDKGGTAKLIYTIINGGESIAEATITITVKE